MSTIANKLKVRSKAFNSIKNKLIAYITIVFALVIGIVFLGNSNYSTFFSEYNRLYSEYNSLNKFFTSLNEATENIKSFCYSQNEEDYRKYQNSIRVTSKSLEDLKSTVSDEDTAWEYQKLSNMLETYMETVNKVTDQKGTGVEGYSLTGYERIININELINRLTVKYFNVVIQDMNSGRNGLYSKWLVQRNITMGILIAIFLLGGFFSVLLLRTVTRPINQLVRNVKMFMQGSYEAPDIKGGGAEIEILLDAFNRMATSLGFYVREIREKSRLQQQLLEKENENLRMRDLLRETELRALQAQMNPHFLFNTLSIISRMAYIEGARQTTELMESTTELLRYNVYKSNKVADLNSEMESVRNYLYIQQKRFGDRIRFELSVEPGLPNIKMPAMIVQPMIENAVIHGVGEMVGDGLVKIIVRKNGRFVRIDIEDNGQGIDSETIENIMASETQAGENGLGIGTINVKKRLEMFFGEKGLFHMESSPGCGTVITVNLPIEGRSEVADDV